MKLQTNWSLESVYSYTEPTNQFPPTNVSPLQTEDNATQQPNTSETENGTSSSSLLDPNSETENGTSSSSLLDPNPLLSPTSQGDQ